MKELEIAVLRCWILKIQQLLLIFLIDSTRARQPTKKELFQIIPMHMMTMGGVKQRAWRCPL